MLDGQVLGASQVEYKPFGKPPLKREPKQPEAEAAMAKPAEKHRSYNSIPHKHIVINAEAARRQAEHQS